MKLTNSYLLIGLLTCCACGVREMSQEELQRYLVDPENGLTSVVEKGTIKIEVNYRPSDVVMAEELEQIRNEDERKEAVWKYDSINYFVMRLSMNNMDIENAYAGDTRKFGETVSYLSYGIADDLSIVSDLDTIKALDVVYSRAFGSAGSSQVMIAFKDNLRERSGPARLVLNDNLFGTGITEFEFDCAKLRDTPRIKFP